MLACGMFFSFPNSVWECLSVKLRLKIQYSYLVPTFGNECIISSSIDDVSGFPNRQAELDLQAFPNRVWERENDAPP
jgi:hypothetical protein